MGWVVNTTPRPLFPRLGPRAVWKGAENLAPPIGIRSPDRPARSQSLYRLTYHDPQQCNRRHTEVSKIASGFNIGFVRQGRKTTFRYSKCLRRQHVAWELRISAWDTLWAQHRAVYGDIHTSHKYNDCKTLELWREMRVKITGIASSTGMFPISRWTATAPLQEPTGAQDMYKLFPVYPSKVSVPVVARSKA